MDEIRHWNVTARVKEHKGKWEKRPKNEINSAKGGVNGDDLTLTFINSDAKRDGEDSVWRLLGPGADSEMISHAARY
jgi:hypothetical protein